MKATRVPSQEWARRVCSFDVQGIRYCRAFGDFHAVSAREQSTDRNYHACHSYSAPTTDYRYRWKAPEGPTAENMLPAAVPRYLGKAGVGAATPGFQRWGITNAAAAWETRTNWLQTKLCIYHTACYHTCSIHPQPPQSDQGLFTSPGNQTATTLARSNDVCLRS